MKIDLNKLREITKLQCLSIPFPLERERALQLCDELYVEAETRPSDSDRIYRKELREMLCRIVSMGETELYERYQGGWRDVLRRYLEATPY